MLIRYQYNDKLNWFELKTILISSSHKTEWNEHKTYYQSIQNKIYFFRHSFFFVLYFCIITNANH